MISIDSSRRVSYRAWLPDEWLKVIKKFEGTLRSIEIFSFVKKISNFTEKSKELICAANIQRDL
jgi:hypothetical protein